MKLEQALQSSKFRTEVQKAVLNILYTAWWLKTITSRELKEFGITHEQYNVLRILRGKHPDRMCVRDIASRMIEKNSNVPRIIDRLELKKLVERSTSAVDKRETVIMLTHTGIAMLGSCTEKVNSIFEKAMPISETEADTLNQLLEKLRQNEQ